MIYHLVFAQINNEEVQNLIVCDSQEMANLLTKKTYGEEAFVVEATWWGCQIGDTYKDNKFYDKDGNEREYWGNETENINALKAENEELKKQTSVDNESILDLDFRVMMLEEG